MSTRLLIWACPCLLYASEDELINPLVRTFNGNRDNQRSCYIMVVKDEVEGHCCIILCIAKNNLVSVMILEGAPSVLPPSKG